MGSLVSTLPFLQEKGANIRHAANLERIDKSDGNDKDRLDLVERLINIKKILKSESKNQDIKNKLVNFKEITKEEKTKYGLVTFDKEGSDFKNIFEACKELNIDELIIDKFIQNHVLKAKEKHNTSLKDTKDITQQIKDSGLFKVIGSNIIPQMEEIQSSDKAKNSFMNAFEEVLLFDSVEKLRYEQYGLNDFYWSLDKVEKQKFKPENKKSINPFKRFLRKSSTKSTDSDSPPENNEKSQVSDTDFNEPVKVESKTFFMDMSFCSPCMNPDSNNNGKTEEKNTLSYVEKVGKKTADEKLPYDETFRNSNFSVKEEKLNKIRKKANKELNKIIANDELPYDEARFEVEQKYQPQAAKIFPDIFKKNIQKDGYSSLIQCQKEHGL
ncbi:MAG: hypothetical protein COV35_02060 [Alphaproteobacteria bacterium CG11_big_fil_rev_8_21_14_0_20_39_49]|nr:MAG: hypothetical protein COV35_02060 [Alphaproteobacteria bacterium CG11_big_fil_rev_8_21_14_0_20_39_49]